MAEAAAVRRGGGGDGGAGDGGSAAATAAAAAAAAASDGSASCLGCSEALSAHARVVWACGHCCMCLRCSLRQIVLHGDGDTRCALCKAAFDEQATYVLQPRVHRSKPTAKARGKGRGRGRGRGRGKGREGGGRASGAEAAETTDASAAAAGNEEEEREQMQADQTQEKASEEGQDADGIMHQPSLAELQRTHRVFSRRLRLFFESKAARKQGENWLDYRCPVCNQVISTQGIDRLGDRRQQRGGSHETLHNASGARQLKDHVRDAHQMEFCNVCFHHRRLFPCEHRLYRMDGNEIQQHLRQGDPPRGHEGAIPVHVRCSVCRTLCFDADAEMEHKCHKHQPCQVCRQAGEDVWMATEDLLIAHYAEQHIVCDHPDCVDSPLENVFADEVELGIHVARVHYGGKLVLGSHMRGAPSTTTDESRQTGLISTGDGDGGAAVDNDAAAAAAAEAAAEAEAAAFTLRESAFPALPSTRGRAVHPLGQTGSWGRGGAVTVRTGRAGRSRGGHGRTQRGGTAATATVAAVPPTSNTAIAGNSSITAATVIHTAANPGFVVDQARDPTPAEADRLAAPGPGGSIAMPPPAPAYEASHASSGEEHAVDADVDTLDDEDPEEREARLEKEAEALERNKLLMQGMRQMLSEDEFVGFRAQSSEFRNGDMSAEEYYAAFCSLLLGKKQGGGQPSIGELWMALTALLPDFHKREELREVHHKAVRQGKSFAMRTQQCRQHEQEQQQRARGGWQGRDPGRGRDRGSARGRRSGPRAEEGRAEAEGAEPPGQPQPSTEPAQRSLVDLKDDNLGQERTSGRRRGQQRVQRDSTVNTVASGGGGGGDAVATATAAPATDDGNDGGNLDPERPPGMGRDEIGVADNVDGQGPAKSAGWPPAPVELTSAVLQTRLRGLTQVLGRVLVKVFIGSSSSTPKFRLAAATEASLEADTAQLAVDAGAHLSQLAGCEPLLPLLAEASLGAMTESADAHVTCVRIAETLLHPEYTEALWATSGALDCLTPYGVFLLRKYCRIASAAL